MLTSKTTQLIDELERCLRVLEIYKYNPGEWNSSRSRTHAAALRASQDASAALVEWRRGNKGMGAVR